MSDATIHTAESLAATALLAVAALWLLLIRLKRTRPDLRVAPAVWAAFGLRILAAGTVSLTSVAQSLRGGDELTFQSQANVLSDGSIVSSQSLHALAHNLHVWLFSLQDRVLGSPEFALRITQVAISVAGVALLVTAVHDLAGARPARLAAWLIAVEPATMFFSGLLHKEALMFLAEGLVIYGGTQLWLKGRVRGLAPAALGCLIAVATRPYAGWFLAVAAAIIALHASLRPGWHRSRESAAVVLGIVLLTAAFAPAAWNASSQRSLAALQVSQNANVTDNSNLKLESVDFSSRSAIVTNLPRRVFDVVFRPYPWQLGDVSQRLGLAGTLATLLTLCFVIPALWRNRNGLFQRGGPLLYVGGLILCAYALSAGNAGTSFRYRTHPLIIAIGLVCVLRARQSAAPAATDSSDPLTAAVAPVS